MRVLCDMLQALSQIQLGSQRVAVEAGSVGFLLWRSVYIVKQAQTPHNCHMITTRCVPAYDYMATRRILCRWRFAIGCLCSSIG